MIYLNQYITQKEQEGV